MEQDNPSVISHVSIGTNDFERAVTFYDAVLKTLDCKQVMRLPGAVAYGRAFPEFWVQTPIDGERATLGNGSHFSFIARSKADVDAFFAAAIEAGARSDGDPGARPEYTDAYYGCFVRDLDGHKIEATYWDQSKAG